MTKKLISHMGQEFTLSQLKTFKSLIESGRITYRMKYPDFEVRVGGRKVTDAMYDYLSRHGIPSDLDPEEKVVIKQREKPFRMNLIGSGENFNFNPYTDDGGKEDRLVELQCALHKVQGMLERSLGDVSVDKHSCPLTQETIYNIKFRVPDHLLMDNLFNM